jgi:hypothetical protein
MFYAGICMGFRLDIISLKFTKLDLLAEIPNLLDIIVYLNTCNFDLGYKVYARY